MSSTGGRARRLAVAVVVLWLPAIVLSLGLIGTLVLSFVGGPALVVALLPVRMAVHTLRGRPSPTRPVGVAIGGAAVVAIAAAVLGAVGAEQWWLRTLWAVGALAWGGATVERTLRLVRHHDRPPEAGDRTSVRQ